MNPVYLSPYKIRNQNLLLHCEMLLYCVDFSPYLAKKTNRYLEMYYGSVRISRVLLWLQAMFTPQFFCIKRSEWWYYIIHGLYRLTSLGCSFSSKGYLVPATWKEHVFVSCFPEPALGITESPYHSSIGIRSGRSTFMLKPF